MREEDIHVKKDRQSFMPIGTYRFGINTLSVHFGILHFFIAVLSWARIRETGTLTEIALQ
jgi:hypothetical protein